MSENCTHDCESCSSNCSSRQSGIQKEKPNAMSHIGKVIAIVSGKGGVGKSLVTAMLATDMRKLDKKVAVLDADITGPSVPKMFGITDKAEGDENGIFPVVSRGGVETMSINLLLEDDAAPVVWRGPVIAGTVKQFWTEVIWGDVDFMYVDMPPGTGDVPLTVFQSLPVDGVIIVTSPQDLVSMIVEKAVRMAGMLNVPVLGIVENMSYLKCPDCGREIKLFGESSAERFAQEYGLPLLAQLPIDPAIALACDEGRIDEVDTSFVRPVNELLKNLK